MTSGAEAARSPSFAQLIQRPIFILSTPRSGSTLLFETLQHLPGLYSTGRESHQAIELIPGLSPHQRGWSSNRLTAEDATPERVQQMAGAFYRDLHDCDHRPPSGAARMLEKTPKNALRVPFLDTAFEDATFVYLHRDVRQTLASMMEAWVSGRFRTYPQLPGWTGYPWSLLLIPGWRELVGQPLPVIVARQWAATVDILLDDLDPLPRDRLRAISYEELIGSPQATIEALAASLGLQSPGEVAAKLPLSKTTVSDPESDKWRRLEQEIEAVMPIVQEADARARRFVQALRSGQ